MAVSPCLARNRANRQRVIARTLAQLPDAATMAARIDDVLAQALPSERADGAQWYPAAASIARIVADGHGIPERSGAAIIAALSPQCAWDENIVRALAHADGEPSGAMADGLRKADDIGAGKDPSDVLGGRKVRSFWRNIGGHEAYVTVDRHAVAIVCGRALTDREIKVLEKLGAYVWIAAAYRAAARRHDLAPSTLQAITWLAWRRIKGDSDLGDF